MKRIAVLCSGGDAPGMNPAVKRFVEYLTDLDIEPFLIYDGLDGVLDDQIYKAEVCNLSGIIHRGGSVIRSARSKRFFEKKWRDIGCANLKKHKIDGLVLLGGDGTFKGMHLFSKECDIPMIGIPTTIDNDIYGTSYTLGTDTSLNVILKAIESIRDTASSYKRVFIIETMGRNCGYLALVSAISCGAEACLIPEIPYDLNSITERLNRQIEAGRTYSIVVVSEALNISEGLKFWFEKELGVDSRIAVLGHIQRGGSPTVRDRLIAYQFMTHAIDSLLKGSSNIIINYNNSKFGETSVEELLTSSYEIDETLLKIGKRLSK